MTVGSLVHGRHDPAYTGIVVEIGPEETFTDHERRACRVKWFDGDETIEFIKMLEVISDG
mgnify:FL=1